MSENENHVNLGYLYTERANNKTYALDRLSVREILCVMNQEDRIVIEEVEKVIPEIEKAVEMTVFGLSNGGRLFLIGAGTSGRMAVIEAAECPPTFSTPRELIQGIIAGGEGALVRSSEGSEDNSGDGVTKVRELRIGKNDTVIGISASGRTPYVLGALEEAGRFSASRVMLTCNPQQGTVPAEVIIAVITGPEVIAGSTRLKAGTATKLILNMITTATMVRMGKVYRNLMVDLKPASTKLIDRGSRIITEVTGCSSDEARRLIMQTGNAKIAIVMYVKKVDAQKAAELLNKQNGFLWKVLEKGD